jgi:hypothetical protein
MYELPDDVSMIVLDTYERFYHAQYKEAGYTMLNIREPGVTGRLTEESKEKIRQANLGKPMPLHVNLILQKSRIGKTNTQEAIRKSNETKFKNGTNFHKEETKKKMSLRKLGITMLPQTRAALRQSNMRPVLQLSLDGNIIREFESIVEAQTFIGKVGIYYCANGRQQTAGGFKWEYKPKDQ